MMLKSTLASPLLFAIVSKKIMRTNVKKNILTSVLLSLLSPLLVGFVVALFYIATSASDPLTLLLQIQLAALSNAYIAGLAMAVCVLPAYLLLYKRGQVRFITLYVVGLLGGATWSLILINAMAQVHVINAVMAATSAAIFVISLRKLSAGNEKGTSVV